MVKLTVTPGIIAALSAASEHFASELSNLQEAGEPSVDTKPSEEPSLATSKVGDPITHAQLIALSRLLRPLQDPAYRLQSLLRGTHLYIPPPPPRPEKSPSYIALMERLRAEQELQIYERMLDPSTTHAPHLSHPNAFPTASQSSRLEDEEVTYADVNRHLTLIANVLISIIACSVAIWMAARHWSAPSRLGLSMTGSGVVAAAEVAIYMGYIRRVKEAKMKERKKVETKEVLETWTVEGKRTGEKKDAVLVGTEGKPEPDAVRRRTRK